ncbi:MAG: sulfatase [Deltaproteobacteria bacterium]|nr:sulfatase [Deltaproteobacteria bacterium]
MRSHLPLLALFALSIPAHAEAPAEKPNVLLLTIDCLRPDHMSLYGHIRSTTPQLEAFAREAWVFENAFATSAWTSPGIVSMLTGYYPPVHGQNGRHSVYDDELASPLRVLAEQGYEVFGRSGRGPTYGGLGAEEVGNLDFETFVRERAELEEGKPFFAWLHSKEPHLPYRPSARNAGRFLKAPPSTPGFDAVREHHLVLRPPIPKLRFTHPGEIEFVPGDAEAIRALYDETVRDADDHLGRAFNALRETGLLEQTVVIVSADHGEELLEHGWVGHASTGYDGKLTEELVRIPLVIRVPAMLRGDSPGAGRSTALVQGVDLMPTLFEWLRIPQGAMLPPMQGKSLAPLIDGRAKQVREHVFLQTTRKGWTTPRGEMQTRIVAVRSADRKLVWWPEEVDRPARREGFDLVADPEELEDLYAEQPEKFRALERARDAWDAENRRHAAALVLPGAGNHEEAQWEALAKGDLLGALQHWRRIALLDRTWGYAQAPFFEEGPAKEPWASLRHRAGTALAAAIDCDAEGRGFEVQGAASDRRVHCTSEPR